ncbi:unnamed protein product, partial [Choristocarpus tenellus]
MREYKYHPEDPRSRLDGYLGNLTESQQVALADLERAVQENIMDLTMVCGRWGEEISRSTEPVQLCLLRFLRANDFIVPKALSQLEENVIYRSEHDVGELVRSSMREILGCDPDKVNRYYPRWLLGHDRLGRPVLAKQYGGLKLSELTQLTTVEKMVNSHVWEQEMVLKLHREKTAETGIIVDTSVVIIDTKGLTLRHVTKDFVLLLKSLAHLDQLIFPETLGKLFIVNTPALFGYVWGIFSPLLDPRTRSKISILSRPKEWKPALLEIVDSNQLPPEYGGTGTPLDETPWLPVVLAPWGSTTTGGCISGSNQSPLSPSQEESLLYETGSGGSSEEPGGEAVDCRGEYGGDEKLEDFEKEMESTSSAAGSDITGARVSGKGTEAKAESGGEGWLLS